MTDSIIAKKICINGIVQGVGFRPFVFQLADHHRVNGTVANTSSGVVIHAEGTADALDRFCRDLREHPPPLSHIINMETAPLEAFGRQDFTIIPSKEGEESATLISPDVAVCDDCLKEMLDPGDRRYRYPFINCTNCGPRYTIIDDIPYDRPGTSMKHFIMCPACQAEYDDPLNRRFHAQPNACPVCGPQVQLLDRERKSVAGGDADPIQKTAQFLKQGRIVAIKGLGGFHLAVDAGNPDAVAMLRERKHREEKPFALMVPDLEGIHAFAQMNPHEETLLTSVRRPIVLLKKKEMQTSRSQAQAWESTPDIGSSPDTPNEESGNTKMIADAVSPRNKYFGVMLPYAPLHHLLFRAGESFNALVMTSANMSEEPIVIDNDDAFRRLSGIADYFLVHNRDIYLRSDDTLLRHAAGAARQIRRSRGFAPMPVFLPESFPHILACGAEQKNTVCLTKGRNAFLSQHIGDLENLETYDFFRMTINHIKRIFDIHPDIIAHDLHPDYLSTRYALEQEGIKRIGVQHHHAHIVSCMAEHGIKDPVIGLAFDGTGYGTDGAVWGGEVLIAEWGGFERAAHLAYIPMPGSAGAIKAPWRMAVSYLYDAFGEAARELPIPFIEKIGENQFNIITQMIQKQINSPLTSSMGRLFDGVSALLGIRSAVSYEGQAAMELEMILDEEAASGVYPYEWGESQPFAISTAPMIRGIVRDIRDKMPVSAISSKFHRTLITLFSDMCVLLREKYGINKAALSGGVFQNAFLLGGMIQELEKRGFEVFSHSQVPSNDGGIALGQAVVGRVGWVEK